ncbi:PREDICTED: tRNA (guanine(10)-N2)-methyltransferase homolog [Nicrophorus vespilloides]|uniref:tRNA (guanine(10)-N(2))-methyltransferase TRMT11 n=1 Tax=Nicrophorus vespilloides TaxID=110193 RepID=A0ABM1N2J5_NICVS|nr:PREDICTED: tRNA (guanine(10)-N2)-methyltransferase homolog [Nicrophorus vespilloides]
MNQAGKRYLLWFAQEHVEFRFQEINSLLTAFNITMDFIEKPTDLQPYWMVKFASEQDAKKITQRSVLLRSCIELWGHSNSVDGLHEMMKKFPEHLMEPHLDEDKSFKIEVETFCKHFTQQEKVDKIEVFEYLPYKGPVKLKDPDTCLQYIEYYGVDPNAPPESPYRVFFGRWIASGLRQLIKYLSLKTRKFIGNTSMDAQLSLLMANQAQIRNGDLVLDPFVGTGSLLVAAAQFGGYVLGSDIDYLMLHARTRPSRITQQVRDDDEGVKANMMQYNLEKHYLDVLVNDCSIPFWRDNLMFDAIITDPPYGIRESTEKIGTSKVNCKISEDHLKTHIPAKVEYSLSTVYFDLLNFSAKHLKMGGRLVCWFPIFRDDYSEDDLPRHPCMKLEANSEQVLTKHTSRRLLTYEKIAEYDNCEDVENTIKDFRYKYYETREESRQERRSRKAELRAKGRLEAERRKVTKLSE